MSYFAKVLDFLRTSRVELAKVVWPSRQQTIKLTVIVIMVTILVGFFLFGVDWVFIQFIGWLTENR